jgi:hypothetical protein
MPLLFSPVYSPTHLLQLQSLFRVCVGICPSSTLLWSMPHFSHCYKPSPLQAQWRKWFFSLAGLFIYSSVRECPSPTLRSSESPALFAMFLFSAAFLLFSLFFSLFFLGGGRSVQRAMLIWPRVVCGSTVCRLAHLLVCFSQAG